MKNKHCMYVYFICRGAAPPGQFGVGPPPHMGQQMAPRGPPQGPAPGQVMERHPGPQMGPPRGLPGQGPPLPNASQVR